MYALTPLFLPNDPSNPVVYPLGRATQTIIVNILENGLYFSINIFDPAQGIEPQIVLIARLIAVCFIIGPVYITAQLPIC